MYIHIIINLKNTEEAIKLTRNISGSSLNYTLFSDNDNTQSNGRLNDKQIPQTDTTSNGQLNDKQIGR